MRQVVVSLSTTQTKNTHSGVFYLRGGRGSPATQIDSIESIWSGHGLASLAATRDMLRPSSPERETSSCLTLHHSNKKHPFGCFLFARWKGLEPSTSAVTGQRSNQLSYHRIINVTYSINSSGVLQFLRKEGTSDTYNRLASLNDAAKIINLYASFLDDRMFPRSP